MKHLLLIDNYDSFTFNLSQILEENGSYSITIKKHDEINLKEVELFDKILFSPGPGLPDDFPIMKQVLTKYAKTKSILGICLGHQAIAEFFGAQLHNFDQVLHGISKKSSILVSDYIFSDLPLEINVGLYHSWYVKKEDLPKEIRISALSDDAIIMAISHKEFDVKGIQFHPESIMTEFGKQILNNWLNQN